MITTIKYDLCLHAGSVNGSRTTSSYLRGVFSVDQLEFSTNSNSNSGKAQQQQQQQPGRGSCEQQQQRVGAEAKKWELEGQIKKRLSWLNTQQVAHYSQLVFDHIFCTQARAKEKVVRNTEVGRGLVTKMGEEASTPEMDKYNLHVEEVNILLLRLSLS